MHNQITKRIRRATPYLATTASVIAGVIVSAAVEAERYVLRERTVPATNFQIPSSGIRVLHLSDLHLAPWNRKRAHYVASLVGTQPDLLILTGDFIASNNSIDLLYEALSPFEGIPGVFVFGSNDYYKPVMKNPFMYLFRNSNGISRQKLSENSGETLNIGAQETASLGETLNTTTSEPSQNLPHNLKGNFSLGVSGTPQNYNSPERDSTSLSRERSSKARRLNTTALQDLLESFGWVNLNNHVHTLEVHGMPVKFIGVNDPHIKYDRFPLSTDEILEGATARASSHELTIGVTHAPYSRIIHRMASARCDFIFAGHTHGGQICLPGSRALVTNCDMTTDHVAGLFQWYGDRSSHTPTFRKNAELRHTHGSNDNSTWVQICAGLGTSPFVPLRTFCPPEANLLHIV